MMERVVSRSWILAFTVLAATAGCGKLYMNDQPCPCASGWTCCKNQNVCVKSGASCQSGNAPSDARAYRMDASSPWSDAPASLPPFDIATNQAHPTVVRGEGWLDDGNGALMILSNSAKMWPPPSPDVLAPMLFATLPAGRIAFDEYSSYLGSDADGTIYYNNNGTLTPLATGQLHPRAVADDQNYVYWLTYGHGGATADGTLARVSKQGGDVQILSSGLPGPTSMVGIDGYFYFTTDGDGQDAGAIMRVPLAGGKAEVIVAGQNQPAHLQEEDVPGALPGAPDQQALLWTTAPDDTGSGRIMRLIPPSTTPEVVIDNANNPTRLHLPYYLNDDGIEKIGSNGASTLYYALAPEKGRDFNVSYGGLWTNPVEGTVTYLWRR